MRVARWALFAVLAASFGAGTPQTGHAQLGGLKRRAEDEAKNKLEEAKKQAAADSAKKAADSSKATVDGSRITTKGFGDTKPSVPNTMAAGRAQNRRVEIVKQ